MRSCAVSHTPAGVRRVSGDLRRDLATDHRDRVWKEIEATPNFWTTLKPIDDHAVARLYQLTGDHHWEVFFITQRPATAGGTVQWQLQPDKGHGDVDIASQFTWIADRFAGKPVENDCP